jgi:hypothetical protein
VGEHPQNSGVVGERTLASGDFFTPSNRRDVSATREDRDYSGENPETPLLGGGEPPIIALGAALAHAIFAAVGACLLQLPMTPERVKAAAAKA